MERAGLLPPVAGLAPFAERVALDERGPLTARGVGVLQCNLGRVCNLACRHCHVQAGPQRTESMPRDVLAACLEAARRAPGITTLDVTGGAPEMNPHLAWFLEEAAALGRRLIVRTNLVILRDPACAPFTELFARLGVELAASLPDPGPEGTDRMRGPGTHAAVLEVLRDLNRRGYGEPGSGLVLDLVHNPVGAYLPGSQAALEAEYRRRLRDGHGIVFNRLYSITNVPVGKYADYLLASGNYTDYMTTLGAAYNPVAAGNVMCRDTVSVSWDGRLYDCDFNQMLGLPLAGNVPDTIFDFDAAALAGRRIVTRDHCYACTAGSGSSCQGATSA